MRFILGLILIGTLAYFSPILLPWWGIAPLAVLVAFLLGAKWWQSLLYGFLGAGIVWAAITISIDSANEGILTGRMIEVLPVGSKLSLFLITGLIGGLISGLGALSGSLLRDGLIPRNTSKKRSSPNIKSRNKRRRRGWR